MINLDITLGDFLDRMSILKVKSERINDSRKQMLEKEFKKYQIKAKLKKLDLENLKEYRELVELNGIIWDNMNKIRALLKTQESEKRDKEIITCSKQEWENNDLRMTLKKKINDKFNDNFYEPKEHPDFKL